MSLRVEVNVVRLNFVCSFSWLQKLFSPVILYTLSIAVIPYISLFVDHLSGVDIQGDGGLPHGIPPFRYGHQLLVMLIGSNAIRLKGAVAKVARINDLNNQPSRLVQHIPILSRADNLARTNQQKFDV